MNELSPRKFEPVVDINDKVSMPESVAAAFQAGEFDDRWHGLWVEIEGAAMLEEMLSDARDHYTVTDAVSACPDEDAFLIYVASRLGFEDKINALLMELYRDGHQLSVCDARVAGVLRMSCPGTTLRAMMNSSLCEKIISFGVEDGPEALYDGKPVPLGTLQSFVSISPVGVMWRAVKSGATTPLAASLDRPLFDPDLLLPSPSR